jgi:hypothetical protein
MRLIKIIHSARFPEVCSYVWLIPMERHMLVRNFRASSAVGSGMGERDGRGVVDMKGSVPVW